MARAKSSKQVRADIDRSYKKLMEMLQASFAKTEPGTRTHVEHIIQMGKLAMQWRDELVKRGCVPEDLGQATKTHYVFTATIGGDSSESQPEFDAERLALNAELDALYGSATPESESPASEPPAKKKSKEKR